MRRDFPKAPFRISPASVDYLVAGCGTGQQVAMIKTFLDIDRMLAIDLSLASLGFAKRMANNLGFDQCRIRASRYSAIALARPDLQRRRFNRRSASSRRPAGRMAGARIDLAPGRAHADRALQRAGAQNGRACAPEDRAHADTGKARRKSAASGRKSWRWTSRRTDPQGRTASPISTA